MVDVCFYFQVHQPYRLAPFSTFDKGSGKEYFFTRKNREVMRKVARKCYLPANKLLLQLIEQHPEFKVSFSLSGVAIDQFDEFAPDVLQTFQALADTGNVEFLEETYYHSLAFFVLKKEFDEQVSLHRDKIRKLFKQKPAVFRNTELIYNNELASHIEQKGYAGIIAEGWDAILGWRSPNYVYRAKGTQLPLLLKNYRLSDDVAFRFSNRDWVEWPLSVEKYAGWLNSVNGNGQVVNLFMDYETFGEHQWAETGIFNFMRALPKELLRHPDNGFKTPSEVVKAYPPMDEVDAPHLVSWADLERDVSAWLGNKMQHAAARRLYALEHSITQSGNEALLSLWRKLQTSDHLYYMCTKWFGDGDVHTYFSPYDNPYEAFITFMNIIQDLERQVKATLAVPAMQ